jgi:hypothetical protein
MPDFALLSRTRETRQAEAVRLVTELQARTP